MANKDYYSILGVSKNASEDDIKKAYKMLSKKWHPDVCKEENATEKFSEINEAYQCLKDKESRDMYDRYGTTDENEVRQKQYEEQVNRDFGGFGHFGSFYNQPQREYGSDVKITVKCTLEELYEGVHKKIRLTKGCTCHHCNGSGSEDNEMHTCPKCNGTGMYRRRMNTAFGISVVESPCPDCNGTGKVIAHKCPVCNGTGVEQRKDEVEFDVPAGMPKDAYFVVAGAGNAGPHRGIPGKLLVFVEEIPNENGLTRDEENNLLYTRKMRYTELVDGCDIEVPWVKGTTKLHIDAGTQSGKKFTLYGKGMPDPNNNTKKANYIVTVECDIPNRNALSSEDKKALDTLKKNGVC